MMSFAGAYIDEVHRVYRENRASDIEKRQRSSEAKKQEQVQAKAIRNRKLGDKKR